MRNSSVLYIIHIYLYVLLIFYCLYIEDLRELVASVILRYYICSISSVVMFSFVHTLFVLLESFKIDELHIHARPRTYTHTLTRVYTYANMYYLRNTQNIQLYMGTSSRWWNLWLFIRKGKLSNAYPQFVIWIFFQSLLVAAIITSDVLKILRKYYCILVSCDAMNVKTSGRKKNP